MIIRSQPNIVDILIAVNGSILPRIGRRLTGIAIVSVIAILAAREHPGIFSKISHIPFTLIGIALSVFMSFRNNACYARWWEGRELWGELTVASRSLARQTADLAISDRRYLLLGMCGFTAGLTARLREENETSAIRLWFRVGPQTRDANPTNTVLDLMGRRLLKLVGTKAIDPIRYSVLEETLSVLAQVQGACERIATTPVPFAYSLLLQRTALIFCVILPFALAGSLDWWTLLPVLLVAYTFFGLDALGYQLEDPFGLEPNCLPLYALRRTVEREMLVALGEKNIPAPSHPRNGILS